jgi:hypothetical protein
MKRLGLFGLALALVVGLASGASAQFATGNIYGKVVDESGAVVPGANVALSGATIGSRTTTSGSQGDFRFLNLDPGTYKVRVSLAGFSSQERSLIVSTGTNVDVTFPLKVTTIEETVTVTSETPMVDTKKTGTSTTLTKEELGQVPNSRDPWAVLRTIPGVLVDRVNIAGNESGQQSSYQGKGSSPADSVWNMDGVVITDMAAIGASPTYFDYDAFEEISVSTGGSDLKMATGGIGLNFVTKRGTNNFHGAIRGYFTHKDLQTTNIPDELKADARLRLPDGTFSDKADHIDQIADYGFDLGGPIVKDKLWFWGSWGKQDIRNVRTNQTKDKTLLKDMNGKINWQASSSDMVSLFWFLGAKEKFGRGVGYIANEGADFLWDQGGFYPSKFHGLYKLEDNHVFSPNFFMNVKLAYYGTGFTLDPKGETSGSVDFNRQVTTGASYLYGTKRPQYSGNIDGNYFFAGMGGNNELKFGFGYRKTPVDSTSNWVGATRLMGFKNAGGDYALVTRDRHAFYETRYTNAYLGDSFTKDRFTLNLGVRYDRQTGGNRPSASEANPSFPNLLPALNFDGAGTGVEFTDISPRISLTYALDQGRKTVLRASYARYAGQLSASDASYDNPLGSISYLAYFWNDRNNDGFVQPSEVATDLGVQYYAFVDPANPANVTSPNKIDPNYKTNHDHEAIIGLDHELFPNFAVTAAYTYRRADDFGWTPRIGMTSADFTARPAVTRNGYTAVAYGPNAGPVAASGGGRILTNRAGYTRNYNGLELSLVKRLSNKWMARAAFSWMDWTEDYGQGSVVNPTHTDSLTNTNGVSVASGPQVNGGQYVPRSGGSGKGDIFYGAKWQLSANALVQLPWGVELAGSVYGKQGFPRPMIIQTSAGGDGNVRVLAVGTNKVPSTGQDLTATGKLDDVRYPNLWDLDLRLAKNVKIAGSTQLQLVADVFNVLNNDVELNRVRNAASSAFNRLDEVLSPRVVRFGVRLQF